MVRYNFACACVRVRVQKTGRCGKIKEISFVKTIHRND